MVNHLVAWCRICTSKWFVHVFCFISNSFGMPRKPCGDRVDVRIKVWQLAQQVPRPSNVAVGRQLGLSEGGVRSILRRYSEEIRAGKVPIDAPREGRPHEYSKRWKKCDFVHFCGPLCFITRHLVVLCRRHPSWGLRQLAGAMQEWVEKAYQSLPEGAVWVKPKLASKNTIRRCACCFLQ